MGRLTSSSVSGARPARQAGRGLQTLSGRPSERARRSEHSRQGRTPRRLIDLGLIEVVLQPIVSVATGGVVAAEALARFPGQDGSPVESVFGIAHASGWGAELEAACLQIALGTRDALPPGAALSVNVSPDALQHPNVRRALSGDLTAIVVEITEKSASNVAELTDALDDLRRRGARIAIDDASTGYAGLLRLSSLRPDVVKLDRGLVTNARGNDVQTVVIEALVSLARRIGARTLGEGVETFDDLALLADLDVDYAQGWAIGSPAAVVAAELPGVAAACRAARRDLMSIRPTRSGPDRRGTSAVTSALAGSIDPAAVGAALAAASADLGVDVVGLSMLGTDGVLHEVTASGAEVDPHGYPLADYPATQSALHGATMVEAHVDDPYSDPAERALLARDGFASLLMTPVLTQGEPLGILEFSHYTHHHWTRRDIAAARTVAEHVASVLCRMREQDGDAGPTRRSRLLALSSPVALSPPVALSSPAGGAPS